MTDEVESLVTVLTDPSGDPATRSSAATELVALDPERALPILLKIAEDTHENPEMLRAAGRELARAASRTRYLSEFELRDVSGASYEAYCDHLT